MASYTVNEHALAQARRLIDAHRYVLRSAWNDVQPSASSATIETGCLSGDRTKREDRAGARLAVDRR